MRTKNDGFIALISVIVITLVLITVITGLATKGFLDRFNILDGQYKEISAGLSSACVEAALVGVANEGTDYDPTDEEICLEGSCPGEEDDSKCTIVSASHSGNETTIQANAVYRGATTNYEVEVDNSNSENGVVPITSWREVTSF